MIQASSGLENLKIDDSLVKKLHFASVDKENDPAKIPAPVMDDLEHKTPLVEVYDAKKEMKPIVAPTIKAEEADEPLLQENPHRFVLFPIKYHEVCVYQTRHAESCSLAYVFYQLDMANVQESGSLLLDRRRN